MNCAMEFVNLFNTEMAQTKLKYLYKASICRSVFFNLPSTADLSQSKMLELLNLEHATINGRTSKVKFTLQN